MGIFNFRRKIISLRNLKQNIIRRKINSSLTLEERLVNATKEFFPESGSWGSSEFSCFKNSLIGNLRNNSWLAQHLMEKELQDVPLNIILDFVENSYFFHEERDSYEQRIVKWQIEWMMSGGEGWLVPKGYDNDFFFFNEDIDIAFRLGILNTLRAIGMDKRVIEKGIEINASLWRRQNMERAFRNRYEPTLSFMFNTDEIVKCSEEYLNAWVRVRLYEYYQAHRDSVDIYGSIVPEMQISSEEVQDLRLFLNKFHDERMAYLKDLKENGNKRPFMLARNLIHKDYN